MVSGGPVDLGLLVAQLGHQRALLAVAVGEGLERQQAVEVQQPQLRDAAAGPDQQHEQAHRLLIAEAALGDRRAEQAGVRHDLPHGHVVEVAAVGGRAAALARLLAAAPQPRVLVGEPCPAWLAQALGGFVAVVGHERVELLDVAEHRGDRAVGERPALAGAAFAAALAQLAEEVQRQDAQLGRRGGQPRLVDAARCQEAAEHG